MSVFTNPITAAKAEAEQYIDAVLNLLEDQEPMQVLDNLTTNLEKLIAGLPDDRLRQPEAPGKWSILEVIHHLADSELVWAYRLRLVAAEDRPTITGYDQDAWASGPHYRKADIRDLMEILQVLRKSNLRLLRSLDENQLQRAGVHSERGEETIAHMIRLYAGHDLVHFRQMERIRASL